MGGRRSGQLLEDLHASDAKRAGYTDEEIQDALAHEDAGTTRIYLKQRMARKSRVALTLPGTDTAK